MNILKEYKTIEKIDGPLIFVKSVKDVSFGEVCEINYQNEKKYGQVLEISNDCAVVQLFEGTLGVNKEMSVKFLKESVNIKLDESIKGRILNGVGKPLDLGVDLIGKKYDINGFPINPYSRDMPNDFIQTGVSAIDSMITLVRGQKLPVFSSSGLRHSDLALQIARQAKTIGDKSNFLVVFGAMGITNEEALKFQKSFEESGAIENAVLFINKADDPSVERLLTPRMALTTAEYFAFEKDYHVLVILTDMTNYCESLREVGAAREEVPGRRGYPGYMYTDLAMIYERAGLIKGKKGSVTQIPILTMPADDKTHPIPDLTGYITEGQIVLDRKLNSINIYPEINLVGGCLSRLMPLVASKKTREDHKKVSDQMYAFYAEGRDLRSLVAIVGEESLSQRDKKLLEFSNRFENEFLKQDLYENREMNKSLEIAWEILRTLPKEELTKIDGKTKDKYY